MALLDPHRLVVLLALLPSLVVLGLGRGVVVCIAPGGHVRVELGSSGCCDDVPVRGAAGEETAGWRGPDDCGPCADVAIAPDPGELRGVRTTSVEHLSALAARSVGLLCAPARPAWERGRARPRVAPGLLHVRSVVLRC